MQTFGELIDVLRGRRRFGSPDARRLEQALRARIAHPTDLAAHRRARIIFDAVDAGSFTVDVHDGKARLSTGSLPSPHATIKSDGGTLVDVLEGRLAGLQAFLEGRLFMRGNIALTLELDDLLDPTGEREVRAPRCRRVLAGGIKSFYLEAGPRDAPAVVLLHGLGATGSSFLPTLWDLAKDHRVFAVDMPGFGESEKPIRPLHPAYFARWLHDFLDAVRLPKAHFVGNSMGGRVALEMGLRSPSRVDRLVLLAPSLAWRRYREAAAFVRLVRPELAFVPMRVEHHLVVGVLKALFARPERVPRAALDAAADEFRRVFHTPRGRVAFFHAAREIYLEDPHGVRGFWNRLPALERPALFIFGDRDKLVPRGFMRHVRRALPRATCETFHDCGHVPQFEFPDLTNRRIRSFLNEPA